MDLKKLFVYVPADKEEDFVNNVIKVETEAAKYANKIVFLEGSKRIWVKGNFYGSDPAEVTAITTKLDSLGNAIATSGDGLSYTNGSYSFSKSFNSGTASTSVVKYAEAIGTYALSAGAAAAAAQTKANSAYTLAESAYSYADNIGHDLDAFKNKVGAINGLTGTLKEYIDAEDASARTEVKVEGSGLSCTKTTGAGGHDIYTITADQSIWEFMGTASATTSTVATVLNGKYGEGDGAVRLNPEQGDVWSVTLADHTPQDTVLYACSAVDTTAHTGTWVVIGSAQGVTGIDTNPSHGVNLTNTANVVGLNVTPGSVASGDTSVVTGGAVFDAVETRIPKTEKGAGNGVAPLNASSKIDNIYITYTNDIAEDSYLPLTSHGAYVVITANERTTSAALNNLAAADTDIISSYEAADAATLEAAKTYTGQQIAGLGLGDASKKGVDTSITISEYTSTNLPTTAAVASYVAGLGLGAASKKGVATSITSTSSDADLPTAAAVYSYVGGNVADIVTSYQNADTQIINNGVKKVEHAASSAAYLTVADDQAATGGHTYTVTLNADAIFNYISDNIWEEYSAS